MNNKKKRFIYNYTMYFVILAIGLVCSVVTIWLPSGGFWGILFLSLGTGFLASAITGFLVDMSNRKTTEQKAMAVRSFDFEKIFYRVLLLARKFINLGLHNGDLQADNVNNKPLDEALAAATDAIICSQVYSTNDSLLPEDIKRIEGNRAHLLGIITQYVAAIEVECDKMYDMQDVYLINDILTEQEIKVINIIRGLIKDQLDPDNDPIFETSVENVRQIYNLLGMTFDDIHSLKSYVVEIVEKSGSVVYFLNKRTNKYFIKSPKKE
ncbi:MAG: hypothetical protein LBN07_04525 [Christensenellaceae bacterium]|jgi:hypothetical protein|nr:hypothetical protein [Christensenellaceae bacterium]